MSDLSARVRDFLKAPANIDKDRSTQDMLDLVADEIEELERRLGGGCDANHGGDHMVMSQGSYKFCGACGESLRGVRYCHEPRK